MYIQRMKRNIRAVIHEHGFETKAQDSGLKSISARHLWNVEHGAASISVNMLEAIADEVGADFLDFFRE